YQRKVYVNEARKAGGNIDLPCVNRSETKTSIRGKDIYLGFDCLQNLEAKLAVTIPAERHRNGKYSSLENFVMRTGAGLEQVVVLIRCGALRFTALNKKELLWEAHYLLAGKKSQGHSGIFPQLTTSKPVLPKLETSLLEDLYDELELIGFTVSAPMFELAKSHYRGNAMASYLPALEGKSVRMVGDFVTDKTVRTKYGDYMKFGTFLDVNGDFFDTVHFSKSLKTYPLRGNGVYLIEGKVVMEFGCLAIEVQKAARMPLRADPRSG